MTYNTQKGNIFLNRVARVGDYWELAGADPAVLPIAKSTKQWKEVAFDDDDAITPRLAFTMLANGIEY